MFRTELDENYIGVHFTQSTRNGQRTPYGYGHDDPGPQDVMAALNTIKTIVGIWKALKSPVEGGISKRDETYG